MLLSRQEHQMNHNLFKVYSILMNNPSSVGKFSAAAASKFFGDSNIFTEEATSVLIKSEQFIDSLPLPLRQDAVRVLARSKITSPPEIRIGHLEIASRTHLMSLTEELSLAADRAASINTTFDKQLIQLLQDTDLPTMWSDFEEAMEELLLFIRSLADLCICMICLAREDFPQEHSKYDFKGMDSPVIFRLPFILLEDVVETLPIFSLQIFWALGPSKWLHQWCREKPNTLPYLGVSKHATTGLLFSSQSSHFTLIRCCNKVLKRQGNPTTLSYSFSNNASHPNSVFCGQVALILASILPLSDPSVVHASGASQSDSPTLLVSEQQFQAQRSEVEKDPLSCLTYETYTSFWNVQKVFADPTSILPPHGKNPTMTQFHDWMSNLGRFISSLKTLFDVLHACTLPHTTATTTTNMTVITNKYIADGTVFHLQLQDPIIRNNILTQILITCAYIQAQSSHTSSPLPIKIKTMLVKHSTNIQNIIEDTKVLLSQSTYNGKDHFNMMNRIINEREPMWKEWKQNKCIPPMEDIGFPNTVAIKNISSAVTRPTDIVHASQTEEISKILKDYYTHAIQPFYFTIDINNDLPTLSMALKHSSPTFDEYFKDYVVALDPEEGIDEEYHPKNDHLWSWRAMRLLNKKCFQYWGDNIVRKTNGDFEGLIRIIYSLEKGIQIPGEYLYLQKCPPGSDCLSDDDTEESSQDLMKPDCTGNHSTNAFHVHLKDAESFSSGEIDEDEIDQSVQLMDVEGPSGPIPNTFTESCNEQIEPRPQGLTEEAAGQEGMKPIVLAVEYQTSVDAQNDVAESIDIESKVESLLDEVIVDGHMEKIVGNDVPSPVENKDAAADVSMDAFVQGMTSDYPQGPDVNLNGRWDGHENESRKRKLDPHEVDSSFDRPSKKMVLDTNPRIDKSSTDRPTYMNRPTQSQSQRRVDSNPRASLRSQHSHNNRDSYHHPPEARSTSTRYINSRPNPYSQPSQNAPFSHSASGPGNQRDRKLGNDLASQPPSNASDRRYGHNRGGNRRPDNYDRSR